MDRRLLPALLITLASLASAGEVERSAPADSLFSRLGGTERVAAFVDATVNELAAQPGSGDFGGSRVEVIKADLVARICALTGGGCRYRYKAHKATTLRAGTELVEALRVAMRTHGVPLAARNELLEALVPTRNVALL